MSDLRFQPAAAQAASHALDGVARAMGDVTAAVDEALHALTSALAPSPLRDRVEELAPELTLALRRLAEGSAELSRFVGLTGQVLASTDEQLAAHA